MSKETVFINAKVVTGYAVIPDCGVVVKDSKVEDIFNMKRYRTKKRVFEEGTTFIDCNSNVLCPGLIDTHIHGFCGFGTEDCTQEAILGMSEALAQYGITSFLPTIYTSPLEKMIAAEKAIVGAMGKEKGARILGINLEGPFISPEKVGGQDPNGIQSVDLKIFEQLCEAGEDKIVCMTVAPELKHMRDLALEAIKKGIVLLAGHTNATYENITEGIQCGILHSTHFFNAMSRLHHRNPGAVGAIMLEEDMSCEIILDGYHVHPAIAKLLFREKPLSNIVLITDSLKPTMQKDGELLANGIPVICSSDGVWVSKANPELVEGSCLVLNKAVKNAIEICGQFEAPFQMASTNPARIYHLDKLGTLLPGNIADITVFDPEFNAKVVMIDGKIIKNTL